MAKPVLDFPVFDSDSHYYEAEDAFIRHVPRQWQSRCMQWATVNGRKRLLVGGRVCNFIGNPSFDPIARPGSLDAFFRGKNTEGLEMTEMFGALAPIAEHPEYREREARLRVMDEQGIDAAFAFPTLGVGMQEALVDDVPALNVAFHAFNRWLLEDWGFGADGRIIGAPMICVSDPVAAVAEVEWCAENGARVLAMSTAAVPDGLGGFISPAWPTFDPVWDAIEAADLPVAFHIGAGITRYISTWEPAQTIEMFRSSTFLQTALHDRLVLDLMSALICHGLFDRHPSLRIASIENGASFVPVLFDHLNDTFGKMPQHFKEHPVETFKRHVWVSPFFEDDFVKTREVLGIDRVLFGSDWPHVEGLAEPLSFLEDVPEYTDDELRRVMSDNARDLLGGSVV